MITVHDLWILSKNIPDDKKIMFYKRDRALFGFLSNFFVCDIFIDGYVYPHSEMYYQEQKSFQSEYISYIRSNDKPSHSKYVGESSSVKHKKSFFRKNPLALRFDWSSDLRLNIMKKVLEAKFSQHPLLAYALLMTGDCTIIEDSNSDFFFGYANGLGQNNLGKLLMELRTQLLRGLYARV